MSTPEEHVADQLRDYTLHAAHNDGAADYCNKCGKLLHDNQLEDINDKLFCADCVPLVCVGCGDDAPEDQWWTNYICDDCKEGV